jgi:predicted MFS family arabinose efflux permease
MIPAALIALAAGLFGAAAGTGTAAHVVSTAMFALGGGLLPPLLSREIASADGGASGSASGLQSAATQAGQTLGAILAGVVAAVLQTAWIFGIAAAPVVGLAAITIWNGRATKLRAALPEPDMGSTYRNSEKEIL